MSDCSNKAQPCFRNGFLPWFSPGWKRLHRRCEFVAFARCVLVRRGSRCCSRERRTIPFHGGLFLDPRQDDRVCAVRCEIVVLQGASWCRRQAQDPDVVHGRDWKIQFMTVSYMVLTKMTDIARSDFKLWSFKMSLVVDKPWIQVLLSSHILQIVAARL